MTTPLSPDQQTEPMVEPETAQAARDLVGVLIRTIKQLRLYDEHNAIYVKALADIGARFRAYLDEFGELPLTIGRNSILIQDETLYTDDDPKEGLSFRLFSDGVRKITFKVSLPEEEAQRAVQVLARGGVGRSVDDDFVTLLWNAGLTAVEVTAVDDDSLPVQELTPTMKKDGKPPPVEQVMQQVQVEPPPEQQKVEYGIEVLSTFSLTEKDSAYLSELVQWEATVNPGKELSTILVDVMLVEKDEQEFLDTFGRYMALLTEFLSQGRLEVAVAQTRGLSRLAAERTDMTQSMREALLSAVTALGSPSNLNALKAGLESRLGEGEDDDAAEGEDGTTPEQAKEEEAVTTPLTEEERQQILADLTAYLGQLRSADPQQLVRIGAGSRHKAVRDAFCAQAIRVCSDDRSGILDLLLERDNKVVRAALMVLARVAQPSELTRFAHVGTHPDVGIRRQAMKAICQIAGGAHIQMLPYLSDADPRIRHEALTVVTDARFSEAADTLHDIIASPAFATWDAGERRELCTTLGLVGGDRMVEYFRGALEQKKSGWFGGGGAKDDDSAALYAVAGLKGVGSAAARQALEGGKQHPSQRVRTAIDKALRDMKG